MRYSKILSFLLLRTIILLFCIFGNFFCINKNAEFGNGNDIFAVSGLLFYYAANTSEAIKISNRFDHSATLLISGKVLVAGGVNDSNALSSAKFYNFEDNTITTIDDLNKEKYKHTATLLKNGKVLISGGQNTTDALNTTEFFEPEKGTFSTGTSLNTARTSHTATLLSDGRVLIAGGCTFSKSSYGSTSTAEIFDPNSNTFSVISMNQARCQHTATLLTGGKVLIVGGKDQLGSMLSSSEIYDPISNTFTYTTLSLNKGRSNHTASLLLNGKVLITGGLSSNSFLSSAELYDPTTNGFRLLGDMKKSRVSHTATLLSNGKVLIVGGVPDTNSSELYDPPTETFGDIGSLPISVLSHTATTCPNGKILIAGGSNGNSATGNIYLYDPNNGN